MSVGGWVGEVGPGTTEGLFWEVSGTERALHN